MRHLRLPLLVVLVALTLAVAACGDDEDSSSDSGSKGAATTETTAAGPDCSKESLDLRKAGRLTIGTDKPAFPPYFEDDDPANGEGFESAVAYAIADNLGFADNEVRWTVVPFNASFAPGPKKFDFDINQISISAKRARRIDFSEPYFTSPQAVIANQETKAAEATTLRELAHTRLGVQAGTTSLDAVHKRIEPTREPQIFKDSSATVRALKDKRVEAIVTDLPTAFYLLAAEIDRGEIVGQFEAPGGNDWGVVMEKGSSLKPCVDKAITELRDAGVLDRLQQEYMGGKAAPDLS